MVVEMIAPDVVECRRGQTHPIQPMLVEPMRGGLDRKMRDALARQFVERLVQRDRIRCRQRSVDRAFGLHDADGAERRRLVPRERADLARELRDRRFPVVAGEGDDELRLVGIETRRDERDRAARIACLQ
jgi:hypothetical protein